MEYDFDGSVMKKLEQLERQLKKVQRDLWIYKQSMFYKERSETQKKAVKTVIEQLTMFGT